MPGPGEQKPKLSYFNIKAKAFPLRVLFNVGNVDFEDCRIEMNDWEKCKGEMPLCQVPVLDYNKQKLCQSVAIAEFIAEKAGMTPNDIWQKSKVLEIICCCEDISQKLAPSMNEKNMSVKKELRDKLCKEVLTGYITCLDKLIGGNSKPGYCVGDKVTAADVYIYSMVDMFKCEQYECIPATYMDKYQNISKVYEMVEKMPKVKECKAAEDKCLYKL